MNRSDIAVGLKNPNLQDRVKQILRENSFSVMELSMQGASLLRWILTSPPKALLVDYEFLGNSRHEMLKIILEDRVCPVILIVSDIEKENMDTSYKNSDYLYMMVKPFNRAGFLANIDFVLRSQERIAKLEREVLNLKETLETRKIVDKAKGILMQKHKITEPDAYRIIQKRSMELRIPMKTLANRIIKNDGQE